MKTLGRVRIDIGAVLLAVAFISIAVSVGCPSLIASDRLAVAQSGHWYTEAFVGNDSLGSTIFETEPCRVAPCTTRWFIPAGGAIRVSALRPGFYTLHAPSVVSWTLLRFDDGLTAQSYAVPPVGALIPGEPQTFGPLANDLTLQTTVNVFPTESADVSLDIIDSTGAEVATETFSAVPPVTQYRVKTFFAAGTIRLATKKCQVAPCIQPPPLYGFVAVADPEGGNAALFPID